MNIEGGDLPVGYSTNDQWRRPQAFASAALVLAVAGLVVPGAGLFAVIVALIARAQCQRLGFVPLRRTVVAISLGLLGTLVSGTWAMRAYHQHTKIIHRANCAANLKQIAQAMYLYSNDYNGRLPTSFDLLASYGLATRYIVCPSEPSPGAAKYPTDEVAARAHGGLSYVMVEPRRSPLMSSYSADQAMAFERLANHDFEGAHILYSDGHPEFVPREQYLKELDLYRGTPGLTEEEYNFLTGK